MGEDVLHVCAPRMRSEAAFRASSFAAASSFFLASSRSAASSSFFFWSASFSYAGPADHSRSVTHDSYTPVVAAHSNVTYIKCTA